MPDTAVYEAPAEEFTGYGDESQEWNGKSTNLVLAFPVVRDFAVVSEGEKITVRASLQNGEWVGPEAGHVRDLFRLGHIAGTSEAGAQVGD